MQGIYIKALVVYFHNMKLNNASTMHPCTYTCMCQTTCASMCEGVWVCPVWFHPANILLSPHPVGCLHQPVSSLSGATLAGNTTLKAKEMQCMQSALQRLLLVRRLAPTPPLVTSRDNPLSVRAAQTQADWTCSSKYTFLGLEIISLVRS